MSAKAICPEPWDGVWCVTVHLQLTHTPLRTLVLSSVIFVNENENGEKQENNEFVNEN